MSKTFEENIKEIEAIVETLEKGDLPLEESIELYKKGMNVLKSCNATMDRIEKELEIIKGVQKESDEL